MSQPTPYVKNTQFTETNTELTPTRIDTELMAVSESVGEICTNLGLIQRDDGALKNGVVTTLSLDSTLQGQIGASSLDLVNAAGAAQVDLVNTAGTTQVGLVNAAGENQVQLATNQAEQAAASASAAIAISNATTYSAGTAYTVGQCVVYSGDTWRNLVGCTGVTPVEGANWHKLTGSGLAATTSTAGIVVLASTSDAQTGTDYSKAVTPLALASVVASTSQAGLVQLASSAQAIAGTDTTTALTPAAAAAAITAAFALPGQGAVLNPSPSVNQTGYGTTVTMTSNEAQAFGDLVYMNSSSKMQKYNATSIGSSPACALALGTITGGVVTYGSIGNGATNGVYLLFGFIRNDSWSWSAGNRVWAYTTAGGLTQTKPSSTGNVIQYVGTALTSHIIYFSPATIEIEV